MSHADMNNCSGFNEAAAAFSWNSPKKAINPYLDPAEVAPVSALSNLITLYAADNEQEQLRREALSDQVWERYFFNESRDPVQREMEQDKLISRAKLAHEQQRFNPDMVILTDVNAQPSHISRPLMQRIEYFSSLGRPKAYSRYLRETIKPCLERLEHVRESQLSTSFRFMASHEGLDGLLILPEMSQDQVKRLSTLVAAHMSMCLDAACGDLYATDDVKPEEIRKTWEKVAAETLRLDVIPPAFEQLRRKRNRRKPVPYELIPGSLARMLCADWWYRKLWKMRCEWREEQLRAVCLVSKKASPYGDAARCPVCHIWSVKDLSDKPVEHIDQTNESDGSFLMRLARQYGAIASVKNGNLLFIRQGQGKSATGKPLPVITITRKDGDSHRFTLADRGAYTGVIASWLHTREPAKKESTTVKRKRRTKKQKKEPEAKQGDYLVGTDENVLVLNRTYANRSNAERAAKMQWERLQRGVASFSLQLAEGRADLYTEMPVKVSGFKQPIDDAEWTITTLTHTVSPDNGFTTSIELEVKIDDLEME